VACTSTNQCPVNQICLLSGACQPCDVICAGSPSACGTLLQAVLDAGGTHYVCPGRYQGGFTASVPVSLIGAGEGTNPSTDTILDATGTGAPGLLITAIGVLERLHLTGGHQGDEPGGGILYFNSLSGSLRMTECTVAGNAVSSNIGGGLYIFRNSALEMTRCTVRDNHATTGSFGSGGGIFVNAGDLFVTTTLTDCLIEGNSAQDRGGGLYSFGSRVVLAGTTRVQGNDASEGGGIYADVGRMTIAETCRVTQNTASTTGGGGGLYAVGIVTLQGADPSPIVVDNCEENCAGPNAPANCAAVPVSCP